VLNARDDGEWLEAIAGLDAPAPGLLTRAAEAGGLAARGRARTLRLARTIADLEGADAVRRVPVAEALIYRRVAPGSAVGSPLMAGRRPTRQVLMTPMPTAKNTHWLKITSPVA
jgi:hypothetical protein